MFNPSAPQSILTIDDRDLGRLPGSEDEWHEYKSSRSRDEELADKIRKAASGFWNSGGGLFVAGVDGAGRPDGGIATSVARTPRRDWVDQALGNVSPKGVYHVRLVSDSGNCPQITAGNAVVFIAFAASEAGPHMAHDGKYYVRAGAHTETAKHYLVEALFARRHARKPTLVHLARMEHFTTAEDWLNISIVSLTDGPAVNVSVDFDPRPPDANGPTYPLRATVVDKAHPFCFRAMVPSRTFTSNLVVKYEDLAGIEYRYSARVDVASSLVPWFQESRPLATIASHLERIESTLRRFHFT